MGRALYKSVVHNAQMMSDSTSLPLPEQPPWQSAVCSAVLAPHHGDGIGPMDSSRDGRYDGRNFFMVSEGRGSAMGLRVSE